MKAGGAKTLQAIDLGVDKVGSGGTVVMNVDEPWTEKLALAVDHLAAVRSKILPDADLVDHPAQAAVKNFQRMRFVVVRMKVLAKAPVPERETAQAQTQGRLGSVPALGDALAVRGDDPGATLGEQIQHIAAA